MGNVLDPYINITIGMKQLVPITTHLEERVKLLSSKKLRFNMNRIYSMIIDNKNPDVFGIEVFREDMRTLFWNSIFAFSSIQLPHDMFLPYESKQEVRELRFANLHIGMNITKEDLLVGKLVISKSRVQNLQSGL